MTPAEVLLGSALRSGSGWQWRRNQEKKHSKYKNLHRQNPTVFYASLRGWLPRNTFSPLFTAYCGRTTLSLHERCLTFHMFGRGTKQQVSTCGNILIMWKSLCARSATFKGPMQHRLQCMVASEFFPLIFQTSLYYIAKPWKQCKALHRP